MYCITHHNISLNSTKYHFWYVLAVPVSAVAKYLDKVEQVANHAKISIIDQSIIATHHRNESNAVSSFVMTIKVVPMMTMMTTTTTTTMTVASCS